MFNIDAWDLEVTALSLSLFPLPLFYYSYYLPTDTTEPPLFKPDHAISSESAGAFLDVLVTPVSHDAALNLDHAAMSPGLEYFLCSRIKRFPCYQGIPTALSSPTNPMSHEEGRSIPCINPPALISLRSPILPEHPLRLTMTPLSARLFIRPAGPLSRTHITQQIFARQVRGYAEHGHGHGVVN